MVGERDTAANAVSLAGPAATIPVDYIQKTRQGIKSGNWQPLLKTAARNLPVPVVGPYLGEFVKK